MLLLPILSLCLVHSTLPAQESLRFEELFLDRTMRIDLIQLGNAEQSFFSVDRIREEGAWPGNPRSLVDESGWGMYRATVVDLQTEELLYSRGFATLFGEYRTTDEAKAGLNRSFRLAIPIPFPRQTVAFIVEGRDEQGQFQPIFRAKIDPENVNIVRESPDPGVIVREIVVNGLPHRQVDLALIAEGYTAEEQGKFWKDAARFAKVIQRTQPFNRRSDEISIRALFSPSAESGVDQPRRGIFRNTAVDSAFNALDLERYLLIGDSEAMRDIAAAAPYDLIVVLANSERYGGGGIYGDYCISTVDNPRSEEVLMHELGHAFANLADEYFGAEVAYNEFFPPGREPHEPNITALLDPEKVKWKHLLTPGIPIPTPWGQDDIMALEARARAIEEEMRVDLERLAEQKVAEEVVRVRRAEYRKRIRPLENAAEKIRKRFQELYRGKVGVFEGAGYSPKGLYRSEVHVGIFHEGSYGPVSEEAIDRAIDRLTTTDS